MSSNLRLFDEAFDRHAPEELAGAGATSSRRIVHKLGVTCDGSRH